MKQIKNKEQMAHGSRSDCKEVVSLIKNINAKLVFADRAYDTNEILSCLRQRSHKKNRLTKEKNEVKQKNETDANTTQKARETSTDSLKTGKDIKL